MVDDWEAYFWDIIHPQNFNRSQAFVNLVTSLARRLTVHRMLDDEHSLLGLGYRSVGSEEP